MSSVLLQRFYNGKAVWVKESEVASGKRTIQMWYRAGGLGKAYNGLRDKLAETREESIEKINAMKHLLTSKKRGTKAKRSLSEMASTSLSAIECHVACRIHPETRDSGVGCVVLFASGKAVGSHKALGHCDSNTVAHFAALSFAIEVLESLQCSASAHHIAVGTPVRIHTDAGVAVDYLQCPANVSFTASMEAAAVNTQKALARLRMTVESGVTLKSGGYEPAFRNAIELAERMWNAATNQQSDGTKPSVFPLSQKRPSTEHCFSHGFRGVASYGHNYGEVIKKEEKEKVHGEYKKEDVDKVFGHFECHECRRKWKSARAWVYRGTLEPCYGQECSRCEVSVLPYKVEQLRCSICGFGKGYCSCERRRVQTDDAPHKQHLCGRCKQLGFSCIRAQRGRRYA